MGNPETGTMTSKTDAKSQRTGYTYDDKQRVTMVKVFNGQVCNGPRSLPPEKTELVTIISPAYSVRIRLQRSMAATAARFLW